MAAIHILASFLLLYIPSYTLADDYRLPTIASPSHYELHINITSGAFTNDTSEFDGNVVIYFTVSDETTEVSLHSSYSYINIISVELNNQEVSSGNYSVNSTTDILTITYLDGLVVGTQYDLNIWYTSRLSDSDMYGFYKSSYEDLNGTTRYLATTQFQTTYARRAFPCWDEPAFKANFSVHITYPVGLNALSNTPGSVVITDNTNGLLTMQFEQTPLMSTYLLAFIVSDFTCTEGDSIDNAPYQVCSSSHTANIRDWALEIGPKIKKEFDEYTQFNYSYSISKLDQVAIPDFAAGAMENWGLVTYREIYLLWDPEESSNAYKQSIAVLIAHEFTHSWFGNLVTCDWWSETFLNEGFAQLLQYYTLHEVLPEWELRKQFVVRVLQTVLDSDSYLTSQALQSPASTPSEISAKFGTITYSKGASVFRMVMNFMGEENFRDGLRSYLVDYQYSNTIPSQLWTSLNATVNDTHSILPADLNTVMENWIVNSGFPLLHVAIIGNNAIITQERFLLSGNDSESKWYVPISLTISTDENKFQSTYPEAWLTPDSNVTVSIPTEAEWIIVNNFATGYYRVNYDDAIWTNIATALLASNFSDIPEENRAQIVNDAFTLARVDKIAYSRVFSIIAFLKNDVSYFSWYPAFSGFEFLLGRIGRSSLLGRTIVAHVSELMENLYQAVPITQLNDTDHLYTTNQVRTITWACRLGKEDCVDGVRDMFNEYKVNGTKPNKNLRSIVYCNGLRYSDNSSDWEFLWNVYQDTDLATERATLITALGCTQNTTLLNRYLLLSITPDSGIRSQDAYSVFSAIYSANDIGVDVAFEFLMENYEAIYEYYQSMNSLSNLITGIGALFTSQEQVIRESAVQALETAQTNLAWISTYSDDLYIYYRLEEENVIDENESTQPEYRLSTNYVPSHYQIHLNVTNEAFTAEGNSFNGSVIIHFTVTSRTWRVILHASDENIDITNVTLNNQYIPSDNYTINDTTNILTITLEDYLEPSIEYEVKLDYDGILETSTRGFFKSSYQTSDGETRYQLATQFQATHARRAFPCFDEPSFKATFQVLITYPSNLNAASNTKGSIVLTNPFTNQLTIQFEKTPVMSSYLVAFVVSDFTCSEGASIGNVTYQVCSRADATDYREFAIESGPQLISSLDNYTGYDYGTVLDKIDNYAIPTFGGAMENWGLVTYGESYLLWNPLESTNVNKHNVFTVMAHEFAHMWFGNLVTCSWWSELFLNEGFATYFEFFTPHDVLPEWELDKQFVVRIHQPVLETDAYATAQALQSPASTPAQISNKFSRVSYYKGGSILRMVEHFMGSDNFRTALQNYLVEHQFSITKPEDLWASLGEMIDNSTLPADLETIMQNWVQRPGYPLLNVTLVNDTVTITQQRFLESGEDITSKWYVPVSYTTSVDDNKFVNTTPQGWLTPTSDLQISWPTNATWIILNNQETAYYRVNYNETLWNGIATALKAENFSDIHELNRAQIADDLFDFAKINMVPYSTTFRVLEFLENDTSYFLGSRSPLNLARSSPISD
ncbi:hypothetical protein NQ318_013854 [Aromia moschata]|uniref:Aminopeptidase N n=1 Tax=Aromia moschata TaxID=1265417 RepID=A0AAV8ZA01_9CUCU|nr:hypothetical protein NQ318_013854 [Aromia moschata]